MSQHDMNVANQGFPAFRADLNNALAALATTSAGATEPSTTFANQFWYDSTANLLKMRNTDNDAWITLAYFDQTNDEWEVRSAVIQAVDSAGVVIKTDDGTTRIEVQDDGDVSIDSGTLFVDATNNRVGIGTSSPTQALDVNGNITVPAGGNYLFGTGDTAIAETSGALRFFANGLERMRIDSSGNLLVGQTAAPLASVNAVFTTGMQVHDAGGGGYAVLSTSGGGQVFYTYTGSVGSESYTERMRIDSSGNLLVGTTSTYEAAKLHVLSTGNQRNLATTFDGANGISVAWRSNYANTTGNAYHAYFTYNGTAVGSIISTSSSTSYSTSSDYRLKENVVDMTGAIDRVKALKPSQFNFITDPDTTVDGFLAHEVQDIVPEAVTGEKDAMRTEEYEVSPALGEIFVPATEDADEQIISSDVERPETLEEGQQWRETTPAVMSEREVPDYQGIDQSKLVPLLTGALQEAIAKIEALEARVQALES